MAKSNSAVPPPATPIIDDAALAGGPQLASTVPFVDLEAALGLDNEGITVVELLVNVACRKPRPTEFFRASDDPEMSRACYVLIDKEDMNETYFVMPDARPHLFEHLKPVLLVTCVNRQHVPFLWPISLPDPGTNSGRQSRWGSSALEAMETAKVFWTKMVAGQGFYRVFKAENPNLPSPQFPDRPFLELLSVAFKDRLISGADHPIVRRLRGQT